MDLQLPNLGQTPDNRTMVSTMETVTLHFQRDVHFRQGCTYIVWGSLCPVWHAEDSSWHVQMPVGTSKSGVARVLGDRAVGAQISAFELFAGGMGGWSAAVPSFPQWTVQAAVDNDEVMLTNFAMNHDFRFVKADHFLQDVRIQGPLALLADVMADDWLALTLHNDGEAWLVSFPCQSWSLMGHGSGTSSDSGRVLLRVVQCARAVQPLYILLENVPGFRQHPEFQDFCKTMEEAGFVLAASVVHDLARLSYTTRRRWLAVFVNTLRVEHWPALGRMMPTLCYDEETFDPQLHCVQMLTAVQREALQISEEEFQELDDCQLLPKWQRNSPLARKDVLALRTCSRGQLFPVVNASYRKAIQFSRDYLGGKGLMSWIVKDDRNQLRWLSKWEACRALAFSQGTVLPADEAIAFHALGNAISPLHAAFALHHCNEVVKHQSARPYMTTFSQIVRQIKAQRADMRAQYPALHGQYHEQLQLPGLVPQLCTLCPFCGRKTDQPLVVACEQCQLIACSSCVTDTCDPSHCRVPQIEPETQAQHHGDAPAGAQFSVKHLFHGELLQLQVSSHEDMFQVRRSLNLPPSAIFFLNCDEVHDVYRPRHNDAFMYACPCVQSQRCPLCADDLVGVAFRFCPRCKRLGCQACVADACQQCAAGQTICHECHLQILSSKYNAAREDAALTAESRAHMAEVDSSQAPTCPLQKQDQTFTALLYPSGTANVPLQILADRDAVLNTVLCHPDCAGTRPLQPVFFWGTATEPPRNPPPGQYIVIVPREYLQQDIVPIVFKDETSERVCLLRQPLDPATCQQLLLSPVDVQAGCQLQCKGQVLQGDQVLQLKPGHVIHKMLPWTLRKRRCGYQDGPQASLLRDVPPVQKFLRSQPTPATAHDQPDTQPFLLKSTVIGLDGRPMSPPDLVPGMSWQSWLCDMPGLPPVHDLWASINGQPVPPQQPLPDPPFTLRLRYRLRGGAKSKEAVIKKLRDHLQTKGVPQHLSEDRANQALQTLGHATIQAAYEALDPWQALKQAAGTKFRLVLPTELKEARSAKGKQEKATSSEDPWVLNGDPWQQHVQANALPQTRPVFALTLVPGHFLDELGGELPILQHIKADAKGVALLEQDELEAMAKVELLLSPEVLAAVTIGTQQPSVGAWTGSCSSVTFPALHQDSKVLFRGFLTNFGRKHATMATAKKSINMQFDEVAVLTVELRQEYILDWASVCRNPLKYVFSVVESLQNATVSNWSRKYFHGRKEVPREQATTWHAFLKVHASHLPVLLASSGKGGAFLTPKDGDSGATSGLYRIVWLDTLDIEKATKVHRLYPELLGIVRGKQSLGVRVRAAEYSSVRKKLEPSWTPEGLTDIVVARRWVLSPLPPQADKRAIQHMLQELAWKATPLKQIAASAWLVGAGHEDQPPVDTFTFAGLPVLITEQKNKKPVASKEVVVAAPPASKRALEHHFAQRLPIQHALAPRSDDVNMPQALPPRCLVSELKEEVNSRLQELQAQMQQAVNTVSQRVDTLQEQAATSTMESSAILLKQDQRLGHLESSMQALSANVVTKSDLSEALRLAMETQAREIRQMLSVPKRSPEGTPTHEAKAPRNS